MKSAIVYLIGAGPGDPELLTIKAQRVLESADVVLYDYLAHPNAVMLASNAKKVCVGKKKGADSMKQDDIHKLMFEYAKTATIIVRLKGGDPMIFGRCGEEMAFLKKHSIPYEIIPGITSAIAAPTYAGIPITHRGHSHSVAFVTATRANDIQNMNIPTADTLIIMMSLLRLDQLVERLLELLPGSTPVAIIESGTLASERQLVGTLKTIITKQEQEKLIPPALLVVGNVANLGEQFKWRDHLPLKQRRFVLFRSMHQQSTFRDMLYQAGAEVLSLPLNSIHHNLSNLKKEDIMTASYIIFTSENGVTAFFDGLIKLGLDSRELSNKIIVSIGEHTQKCLNNRGILADIIPEDKNSRGIIDSLVNIVSIKDNLLIPTSSEAGSDIIDALKSKVSSIKQLSIYTNKTTEFSSNIKQWVKSSDELIFMNAATVHRYFKNVAQDEIKSFDNKLFSIGPKTTTAIQQYVQNEVIETNKPSIDELLETIIKN